MKRVLVTGGTGFIGANLVRRLLKEKYEVELLVRPGYSDWRIKTIEDFVNVHEVSLTDSDATYALIRKVRPEWVFHLATHGAYSWQTDWQEMMATNIHGTINLVEACATVDVEAFVNAGSSAEYGLKDHAPKEDEAAEPNSRYAVTKLAGTQYCRFIGKDRNLPVTTLRLYSVYGPYENPDRMIPNLIVRGFDGKLPALIHPAVARDYIFVDDVCDAMLAVAAFEQHEPGAVYNIGSGHETTVRQLVEMTSSMLGVMTEPQWGTNPNRTWDTTVWVSNIDKVRSAVEWTPKHTLENGLAATVHWFRKHDSMLDRYRKHLGASYVRATEAE